MDRNSGVVWSMACAPSKQSGISNIKNVQGFFYIVVITDIQYLHTHCAQANYVNRNIIKLCKFNRSAGHMFQHLLHCNINSCTHLR